MAVFNGYLRLHCVVCDMNIQVSIILQCTRKFYFYNFHLVINKYGLFIRYSIRYYVCYFYWQFVLFLRIIIETFLISQSPINRCLLYTSQRESVHGLATSGGKKEKATLLMRDWPATVSYTHLDVYKRQLHSAAVNNH